MKATQLLFITSILFSCVLNSQTIEILKNINPDLTWRIDSDPSYFTAFNGKVYFSASEDGENYSLWVTNGSEVGTYKIFDINGVSQGDHSQPFYVWKDHFYFAGQIQPYSSINLWKSDGTSIGTIKVHDVNPLGYSSSDFAELNDHLIFAGLMNNDFGIWSTDGSGAGTQVIKTFSQECHVIGTFAGKVFFLAPDDVSNTALWMTNGTLESTQMIFQFNRSYDPSIRSKIEFDGKFVFVANFEDHVKLFISDGTTQGTFPIKSIDPINSNGYSTILFKDKLFFSGISDEGYSDLCYTDGTIGGTICLDINQGNSSFKIHRFAQLGDRLLFTGGVVGTLWESDGTKDGTSEIPTDILYSLDDISTDLVTYHGRIYFSASGENYEKQLWVYDDNSNKVNPANITFGDINEPIPTNFHIFQDNLYFFVTPPYGEYGSALWKTDGTQEGTERIGIANVVGFDRFAFDEHLYYFATVNDLSDIHLWVTDGTFLGTKKIEPEKALFSHINQDPLAYIATDEFLIIRAAFDEQGYEPYIIRKEISNRLPNDLTSKVCIFPNPIHSELIVKSEFPIKMVRIIDVTGRPLIEEHFSENDELYVIRNLSARLNGINVVEVYLVDGRSQAFKIIVH